MNECGKFRINVVVHHKNKFVITHTNYDSWLPLSAPKTPRLCTYAKTTTNYTVSQEDFCISYVSALWLCDLAQLEMIPVVADEAEDLLQFKVLFLTLHSQVVQGQMDHIHPDERREQWIKTQNIWEAVSKCVNVS